MTETANFPFSCSPLDYPNMGLRVPLWVYEFNWHIMGLMSHNAIAQYADAVVREGVSHETYVRKYISSCAGMFCDQNPEAVRCRRMLNFGHMANCLFIVANADKNWSSEEDRTKCLAFVDAKRKASLASLLGRLAGYTVFALAGLLYFWLIGGFRSAS